MSDNSDKSLKVQMDEDKGFQSKRRVLVTLSLLFIGIKLSGVEISEANTFIFKLTIENTNAIGHLFFFALIYTFFRYYTYASKYHKKLYRSWSQKLLNDHTFHSVDHECNQSTGLIPENFPRSVYYYNFVSDSNNSVNTCYLRNGIFKRSLIYEISDEHDYEDEEVILFESTKFEKWYWLWINTLITRFNTFRKILVKEQKYQLNSYFHDREQLDLFAPYLLAIIALCCQFYSSEINNFLGIT